MEVFYTPASTVNMCYASIYGDWMVLQMVYLCTALTLLQNGSVTSGNDVFFGRFWSSHGMCMMVVR